MKTIFRGRGRGKTTRLIYLSEVTGCPIVAATRAECRYIRDLAAKLDVDIPDPIPAKATVKGLNAKAVLIDNIEDIINLYAQEHFGVPAMACTMTVGEDSI